MRGNWFGANSYKWDRLSEYALSRDETSNLLALCFTYFEKGLLEWRLSTEAAVEFLGKLPEDAFFEFSYDELTENSIDTISQVLEFIGIEEDSEVSNFVSKNIVRQTSKLGQYNVSEKEQILGGKLLPLSMNGKGGLTRYCIWPLFK
jgi:hypothetical protein